MSPSNKFSRGNRFRSFGFALEGCKTLLIEEPNAIIHFSAAIVTVILGFCLNISSGEWLFIILAISLVIAAELFNTALEVLCDFVHSQHHPQIKKVKDLAAGSVLMLSLGAFIGGLIIFIPKII